MSNYYEIVCIDDEEQILEIYSSFLSEHNIKTFISPIEAFDYIKKNFSRIAFIISDYTMAEMTGFDLREKMMPDLSEIPYLIVTGNFSSDMAKTAFSLKISGILEKPISAEKILSEFNLHGKIRVNQINEEIEMVISFVNESTPMLEEIESLILSLEHDPQNLDVLNTYFRLLHTIKGTAACVGLHGVAEFTHKYEDLINDLKNLKRTLNTKIASVLLKGLDTLKLLYQEVRDHARTITPPSQLVGIFNEENLIEDAAEKKISDSDAVAQNINTVVHKKEDEKLSVPMETLDEFMELSGELTVLRNSILKSVMNLSAKYPNERDVELLSETFDEMHKVSSSLQHQITEMRKVSMDSIYRPLKRVVRDASKNLSKQVKFEASGAELLIDTSIGKVVANCLIHLLRNSIDHGIETPEIRKSRGKNPEGIVALKSFEQGENVVIEIKDDGNGLDPEKLKKKAIEKNLITKEEALSFSDQKAYNLIFASGFSTAAQVTDISGRGVGMDMVKSSVTNVGGKIIIDSSVGGGSTFKLILPIPRSVLIIKSLMVRLGDQKFCLALEDVAEVINGNNDQGKIEINKIDNAVILKHHDELVPLISLGNLLNTSNDENLADKSFILLRHDGFSFGIVVDEILDIEEVVVKKFIEQLKFIDVFGGATLIGEGEIAMILDVKGIARKSRIEAHNQAETEQDVTKVAILPMHEYLNFKICEQFFAIPLETVFRLEEFKQAQVEYSGDIPLIHYRDSFLPLLNLHQLLRLEFALEKDNSIFQVIVVKDESSQLFGLMIDSIEDIVATTDIIDTNVVDGEAIKGTIYLNERLVTVLDKDFLNSKKITRSQTENIKAA